MFNVEHDDARLDQLRKESNLACSRVRFYERAFFEGKVNANPSLVNPDDIHYPKLTEFGNPCLNTHWEWLLQRQYHYSRAFGEERPYYFFP